MKKTLFMCALGLTVATSMVAGTMAIYTHSDTMLATNNGSATAKKFYIGIDEKVTDTINMRFAPGEQADWKFSATNVDGNFASEVDTDMTLTLSADSFSPMWNDFRIQLVEFKDDGTETVIATSDGVKAGETKISLVAKNQFTGNIGETKKYAVRFKWLDKTEKDGADIAGTQNDEYDTGLTYKAKSEADLPSVQGLNITITGSQNTDNLKY